ncbi:MAG: Holliday junction resolvase RuvX [Pelagibacteraceae bacterium]|nr:Holliday junction resolvase RuvX [Pelagibacteraceae bacterium]|tara:strand:- start:1360 stop:1815 length:456 start_codon:yes stop_codon:yes gene_type:complete
MMEITELKKILNTKSRLIGVDMGTRKVGISISDENRKIATPLKTIDYKNIEYLGSEMQKIVKENDINAIIFGNPLNMDGTKGAAAQSIKDKIKLLCDIINLPMFLWDERLSTVGAFNLSSQLDINVSKRVKNIDKNAATFILQGVLDYLNN